jgi:hypothetical protein
MAGCMMVRKIYLDEQAEHMETGHKKIHKDRKPIIDEVEQRQT